MVLLVAIAVTWSVLNNAHRQYYFCQLSEFDQLYMCGWRCHSVVARAPSDLSAIATSWLSAVAGSVVDRAVPPKKP